MSIVINPGSGPVRGASRENAEANMTVFIADLKTEAYAKSVDMIRQPLAPEDRGRFTYIILADGEQHEIEMPGLPIEQVRWMDRDDQNIWDFPRLYVDGDSWVWKYALSAVPGEVEG